ncbi:MAG TPA: DNA topoisomerase IV subunit A [Vicinamibacterales bacterium]|jgi:DNA gyrase subunit A|nr:DNA topoisomerase IV subunit A [Vicinamibacterales bacterium]
MAKRPAEPSLFDDNDSPIEPTAPPPPAPPRGGDVPPAPPGDGSAVSLHEAAQSRYLNYALSVITSRALPDVRDGLKPVQRRILYTMWQQNLTADAKHRKCAKVVGDVMGNYHPHGDSAIYETLVRMAQSFSLRYPLIDGSGNFGSLDGDAAAAMRYTECRLARLSDEVLQEIEQETVHFRPSYDGTKQEPVVLPSRIPNLLVNGATGIAVGMATNIPPHNLHEICNALIKLLDDPDLSSVQLCRWVKGPDFPTGGHILNSPTELKEIYQTGSGSVRIRSTWELGPTSRSAKTVYVTSVPYGVNKAQLVEQIGEVVLSRKMPHLVDVKDLSTDDVRIELELKGSADENLVMAYLFKHTSLQTSFAVNLTCLVPTENAEVGRPERLDLKQMLWHFLHFRLDVVTSRLEHELAQLQKRIHILEGFEKVFDALDEIIKIIRKSDGKADAAEKIIKRFSLDAEQTDAILELKLYRLARLEILVIQQELSDKRKRVRQINALLKDENSRWRLVRDELQEIQKKYGDPKIDPRRTRIEETEEVEYSADAFIVDEDNVVIVSRDGWVKRQKEVKDLATTRLREGDSVLAAMAGSTRATVVFFSNFGSAYTARFVDVPASTGYGEPVQKLFKFKDGERVIAALSLDARVRGDIGHVPEGEEENGGRNGKNADAEAEAPPVHAMAVTSDGYSLRFSLAGFVEPSTRAGRRYARVPEGQEVVAVARVTGEETIIAATKDARAILCSVEEVNFLSGPGRGVILIKVQDDDRVIGAMASTGDRDLMTVETSRGGEQTISTAKYEVTGRGGKGRELMQRGGFTRVIPGEVALPELPENG